MTAARRTLWLYAVTSAQARPPSGLTGLDDAPVQALPLGAESEQGDALHAWASVAPPDDAASLERLRAHDRVVAAAHATGSTPIPMRFGHRFPSADALVAALAPRWTELAAALAAVAGREEWRIAGIIVPEPGALAAADASGSHGSASPSGTSPGRARLEAARDRLRVQAVAETALDDVRERVRSTLGDLALEVRPVPAPGARGRTLAYLAPRSAATTIRERVCALLPALAGADRAAPLLLGPMAPWTFVKLS